MSKKTRRDVTHAMEKEERKPTAEELIEKSRKPAEQALRLHPYYHGKLQVMPKAVIRNYSDFGVWYTRPTF